MIFATMTAIQASERHGPQDKQIEYFEIGHYAGYNLVGRTEVNPCAADPDFKSTGRYWLFGLYPILSPQEIRGRTDSFGVMLIRNEGTTFVSRVPAAGGCAA